MRQRSAPLLLAATLLSTLATPALAGPKEDLQKAYTKFLTSKGLSPSIDSDGDVQFSATPGDREFTFFIDVAPDDPAFFRVALANIWPIESAEERTKVHAACDVVNSKLKVVKCYTSNDNVWATVETFQAKPTDYQKNFDRMMIVLDQGVNLFVETMQ